MRPQSLQVSVAMNITPLIDVLLVLLVIFLCRAAHVLLTDLEIDCALYSMIACQKLFLTAAGTLPTAAW